MSNQVIGHIQIPTLDLENAAKFYNTVFGWNLKPFGNGYYLCNSHQGMTIGLKKVDKVDTGNTTTFHINVANIDDALAKVMVNNGKVLQNKTVIPVYGYYALINDLDGNTIGLYQSNY